MMRTRLQICLFVGASILTSSLAATASPITFAFTGTVTQVSLDDPDIFGGSVGVDTPFSGSYTFESTASDGISAATDGSYASPFTLSVDFSGDSLGPFSVTGFAVNTRNGSPDQYGVYGNDGTFEIQFLLESSSNPLSTDALPLTPPTLASFTQRLFTFRDATGLGLPEILGTIDSLACTDGCAAVPEPGTLGLLALGIVGSAIERRRRTQARHA
jgi:hypothetical protein